MTYRDQTILWAILFRAAINSFSRWCSVCITMIFACISRISSGK